MSSRRKPGPRKERAWIPFFNGMTKKHIDMTFIDNLLNKITMYRLVLYVLAGLALIAAIFGALGILPYSPLSLLFSIAVLIAVSWIANKVFADAFETQTNIESTYITALILALIISPVAPRDLMGVSFLVWAAIWATASKYIFALNKKHLFNPAAFAVALTALTINQSATWWIGGNLPMLAFVILGGLLITRKIRRGDFVLAFFVAAAVSVLVGTLGQNPLSTLEKAALHAPLFFLRVRDAHGALDHATDPRAPHRLWRFCRDPVRAVGSYRIPLFHAGACASRR